MKKLFLVLMILAVASLSFAQSVIGIAMPETHVQRWVKDGNTLKSEADKKKYRGLVQWANGDQATQNQQIQSFLTQGAKALIIGSINNGVGSVVSEAAKDGVIVIAYDRIIQNSNHYDYYVTFNNYKVGQLQGQAIADALNLKAATAAAPKQITLFGGSPTDANAFFFFNGAIDVLNPFIDKGVLKVVGPYPKNALTDRATFQRIATEGWQGPIAKQRMENLLSNDARNVTLDAVLAPNDTLGRAIIEALKADAKYRTKLPVVTGQDAEFASMLSIKNGEQYMTVFKDTAKLAQAAILLADQVLKGQKVSIPGTVVANNIAGLREIANTGTRYVTTYLLDPVAVTKANLTVPVKAGFYTAAENAQLNAK